MDELKWFSPSLHDSKKIRDRPRNYRKSKPQSVHMIKNSNLIHVQYNLSVRRSVCSKAEGRISGINQ